MDFGKYVRERNLIMCKVETFFFFFLSISSCFKGLGPVFNWKWNLVISVILVQAGKGLSWFLALEKEDTKQKNDFKICDDGMIILQSRVS